MSDGTCHHEVGNFVTQVATKCKDQSSTVYKYVDGWFNKPLVAFPTSVARNQLVKLAQEQDVDFLWMIDSDCHPDPAFFESSFHFLRTAPEPSVIAAPYVSGNGDVMVFECTTPQVSREYLDIWNLTWIPRGDAFRRDGIERVASIGTHLIAYDMRVFQKIKKPYYQYLFNEDHTALTETEDCHCHRQLFNAGVPMYCDWDHWAGHFKSQLLKPVEPLQEKDIHTFWLDKAKEVLLYEKSSFTS